MIACANVPFNTDCALSLLISVFAASINGVNKADIYNNTVSDFASIDYNITHAIDAAIGNIICTCS